MLGMGLHGYIRQKRLLACLLRGAPSVKAVALENGFWHLGGFARANRTLLGELPSQTRSRAARGEAADLISKHPAACDDCCAS
ncbi:AraC family transcriptional regulator [Bradyrhizobium japonicum]|nr:AraC family transcriptional regulator [Bradyrhizobium japonicum]